MHHVQLTKVSSIRGQPKALTNGYTVKGHALANPETGRPFTVIRYERNGVRVTGIMHTSTVQSIKETTGGWQIKTLNSTYRVTRLVPQGRAKRA